MAGATAGVLATAAVRAQSAPAIGTLPAGTPTLATPTVLPGMTFSDVASNGITLHVTQIGTGDPLLFCHGFPDTSRTWWRHMQAVADAGYRAIAPDMRGYGRSSAPDDANLYTPFDTVGDMVGLLDALSLPTAVIVGHDWGADVAFQAAMMRPDRFPAVFGISGGAYTPRGEVDTFEQLRAAGLGDRFYVFSRSSPRPTGNGPMPPKASPRRSTGRPACPLPARPGIRSIRRAASSGRRRSRCRRSPTRSMWPGTSPSSSAPAFMAA